MIFSPYAAPENITGIDKQVQEFFGCNKDQISSLNSYEAIKEVASHTVCQDITIVVGMDDTTIDPEHGTVSILSRQAAISHNFRFSVVFLRIPCTPYASCVLTVLRTLRLEPWQRITYSLF
jgi:hypothetical protein